MTELEQSKSFNTLRKISHIAEYYGYSPIPDLILPSNSEPTRYFTLISKGRSYALVVGPLTTLDTAWASQKCWFMPGSIVIITDDRGNSKTFIKE